MKRVENILPSLLKDCIKSKFYASYNSSWKAMLGKGKKR